MHVYESSKHFKLERNTTLRTTFTHKSKVRLTPSIDVAISRVCAVVRVFAVSLLYIRLQIDSASHRVWLGSHGFFLGSQLQHYLVVESVFFEVQLARTRSQSNGRIRGRGWSQPMREPTADRNTKNPAVNHVLCSLLRLSHKTRFGSFFFNAYSYFYVFSHEGSMSPFIAELSWHVSSPRGKLFAHFIKPFVTLCTSDFQYPDDAQHVIEK